MKDLVRWESYHHCRYDYDKEWVGTRIGKFIVQLRRKDSSYGSVLITIQKIAGPVRYISYRLEKAGYETNDIVVSISTSGRAMFNMDIIDQIPTVSREGIAALLEFVPVSDLEKISVYGLQSKIDKTSGKYKTVGAKQRMNARMENRKLRRTMGKVNPYKSSKPVQVKVNWK